MIVLGLLHYAFLAALVLLLLYIFTLVKRQGD